MTAAARKRRQRERERRGVLWLPIECDVYTVDVLCILGWLDPLVADDPEAVRSALQRVVTLLPTIVTRDNAVD